VGGGKIRSFLGTYAEFLEESAPASGEPAEDGADDSREQASARAKSHLLRERKRREAEARNLRHRKITPLKQEVTHLEREIEEGSRRLQEMEEEMADPEFYRAASAVEEKLGIYGSLKAEVAAKTERWAELSLRLEELERESG